MKLFSSLLLGTFLFGACILNSQSTWDDFDNPGKVAYPFFNGTTFNQSFSNPSTTGVNTSSTCAQYTRNGGSQYDVILIEPTGTFKIASVADFKAGTKSMSIKVYSPAAGKTLQITLEDKNSAGPTNYPTGRHSEYTAVTTAVNTWETLTFSLVNSPDTTVSDTNVTTLVLLFDPNSFNSDTYLFDDLMGPTLIDPCASVPTDTAIGEDYECQRNVSFDFSNGTHLQNEVNPLTSGINTSTTCGKFIKFIPPTNDGAFGGTIKIPFVSTKYNTASIDLYSPAGAYDFKMVFQDASGTDILDSLFTTSTTPGWSTFNMDLSGVPASTSFEKFVFLVNSSTATPDSIFLDNFRFLFDNSVGINENKSINTLKLFPNPFSNQITVESKVQIDQIRVMDLTGKTLIDITEINNNKTVVDLQSLLSGSYLIQILDVNGNFTTERIIKNN
ncbi:MAG: T9SS type A sorting domain-containing protein [Flavobacteriales bacterium]